MRSIYISFFLIEVCLAENISPWVGAVVEASGIYQNDHRTGDNVLVCYEFFRPCPTDSSKSMINDGQCGNDIPYTIASIHDYSPFACTQRPAILVDSTKLFALLAMPDSWHKKAKDTKNYFQSDSLKEKEGWKLKLYGLSEQDKLKLKTYGVVRGMLGSSIYLQGEKCKSCN